MWLFLSVALTALVLRQLPILEEAHPDNAPIQAIVRGQEIKLGMTRDELYQVLGQPPPGYDHPDEMLWCDTTVSRCFLEEDRVVAIQARQLIQSGKVLVDDDDNMGEFVSRLGPYVEDGHTLVFSGHENKLIAVGLEPEIVGHWVTFIGVAKPGFAFSRFQTGVFPP